MKKFILSIIMVALLGGGAWAYEFSARCSSGQTLYYHIISSETVSIVGQNSSSPYYTDYPSGNLVIPTSVTYGNVEYSVTGIGTHAFDGCSGLMSVTISNSIEGIGSYAFNGCSSLTTVNFNATTCSSVGDDAWAGCTSLTTLNIGSNVTRIPTNAFKGCSRITAVTIPNSVTDIYNAAFSGCSGLTTVYFYASNCTYVGTGVWSGCTSLRNLNFGPNVTAIPAYLFRDAMGLSSVTIPNTVTSIGYAAFSGCSGMTSLTIGSNVTNIVGGAFSGCSGLTTINFNATNCTTMGSSSEPAFNNSNANATINIGNGVTRIPVNAFKGLRGNGSLIIPGSVTDICGSAFSGCSGLTGVLTIPNSVSNIYSNAFDGCSGLTRVNYTGSIAQWCGITFGNETANPLNYAHNLYVNNSLVTDLVIPSNITEIKNYTFCGASALTSVTIHESVASIGSYAFNGCSGLTTVNFNATNCTMAASVFRDCNATATINIGSNVITIPDYAFEGLLGNGALAIPNSVTSIGQRAFYNCSGLTSVAIGNSVTNIGDNAFYNCSSLTGALTIPNSVTSIGNSGFSSCGGLTSVTIGSSVERIDNSAFSGCIGLTSVCYTGNIRQWCGITFVNEFANPLSCAHNLYVNNNLVTDLAILNTVTEIKNYAFYGATCLTSVTIPNSVTSIGGSAFNSCSGLTSVTIGNSVTSIGGSAFNSCSSLASVTIPNSVTSIGSSAFSGCSGLASVSIGNSVTSIGQSAFKDCSGLTSITIPSSVTSIGRGAFQYCSSLKEMTIPFVGGSASATSASVSTLFGYIFNYVAYNDVTTTLQYYSSTSNSYYAYIPSSLRAVTVTSGRVLAGAFYNCSMLTSITIGEGVTFIGDNAFHNCSGLTDIYVNRTTPPNIWTSSFNNRTATVWVPCGSASAYRTATGWSSFSYIRESRTYMLSISSANLQQGTAIVAQQPDCTNGTAIIEALPNIGHYFAQWNDGNTDNPRTITVTSNTAYTAEFAINQHMITVVSANVTMGTVSEGGIYDYGSEIQISATASDGYRFTAWNDGNIDNPRTITVTQDSTFTANFIAIHTITVQSGNDEMGGVSGSGVYDENSEIQISATPAEHYHFVQWNDGNTDNPRTITVTEDATYTAEFAIDQHTITVESANTEMGTVSESGTYDYETEIQISATANDGFRFIAWNDGDTNNPRTITVTQDSTFTANFIALHTITVLSADEEMGTAIGTGVYDENSEIEIYATPAEHYHFVQWNDGNTDNPRTITVVEDTIFTAEFAIDRFTVTVESADTTMGTVSESGTYDYGVEIEISASASEHYHFVQWSDGNTDNPRMITVVEDTTFTAEFAIDQHTITVESADTEMGTVSEGGTYDYGTEIQISASARDGYQFASWNDDNTENPRTITVVADATYIASFIPAVGIDESIATEIAIFPNPANDILNITSSETISEIEIVNVMGQVVKRIEVNSDNVVCNVEDLKAGVYGGRIRTASATLSQRRFVKE